MTLDDPGQADLERLYHGLALIRRVEERVAKIYPSDKIKSPVHLSIGQESVAVGTCDILQEGDYVSPTYRGHAAYLAKGGDLNAMMAELYGKATGCAGGKGGSMHLVAMDKGVLGTSAVVGTTIPIGVGVALSIRMQKRDRVVVNYFGDGATEEGVFHESLNFAALKRLPVLFVCENNGFAIHTGLEKRWATDRLVERVATYGMPAERIEDADVFKIRAAAGRLVAAMREGGGPAFLECATYRWREHVGPGEDYDKGFRTPEDLKPWKDHDQVERVGRLIGGDARHRIDVDIADAIDAAVQFAEESPWPEPEMLMQDVYGRREANR